MLLWKMLVDAARTEGIDRRKAKARAWIHRHLPELLLTPADARGRPYRHSGRVVLEERFDWEQEWPGWQDSFRALLWVAGCREKPPKPRSLGDYIPLHVQQTIDQALGRVRLDRSSDWFSEDRPIVRFSGGAETAHRFASVNEFWEVVFVGFYWPEAVPHGSVCSACGAALASSKKTKKPSRARLCDKCRLREWRRRHPEQQRELWRQAKRRQREEEKRALERHQNRK